MKNRKKYLGDNEDLIRVGMMESLKKNNTNPPMLNLMDTYSLEEYGISGKLYILQGIRIVLSPLSLMMVRLLLVI